MIFYFSGTGNSRWVASKVSAGLHETLHEITGCENCGSPYDVSGQTRGDGRALENGETRGNAPTSWKLKDGEPLGFIFPVHAWSPPRIVLQFIADLKLTGTVSYLYYICTCGDDTGKTERVFRKVVGKRGWTCSAGYSVFMPNTYVSLPGFDVDPKDVEEKKRREAVGRVDEIISSLKERQAGFDCHEGTVPWIKTYVLGPYFRKYLMDVNKFRTNQDCVGCGTCEKVCQLKNISLKDGRPTWGNRCSMCLACYHHCPSHALHYGKATEGKGQYLFR